MPKFCMNNHRKKSLKFKKIYKFNNIRIKMKFNNQKLMQVLEENKIKHKNQK